MTLNRNEQGELERLLWLAQGAPLSPSDERKLRNLVAKQNPGAQTLPLAQLVTAGLVVLGAILLLQAIVKD